MKLNIALIIFIFVFISCSDKNTPSSEENEIYSKMGQEIVQKSFATLKLHLGTALKNEGFDGAIQYCNLNAYSIMDTLSKEFSATIRRTSLKVRNPNNSPNSDELDALNFFTEAKNNREKLHPIVRKINDSTFAFYAPILINNKICLGCHGVPGESNAQEIFDNIKELYPDDKATGYEIDDLRGMWSVRFGKQEDL